MQDCCDDGTCCPVACEQCLDYGTLSGGTISVAADPVCVGDSITFTVSGVTDDGAIQRVDCTAKTWIPPGTISYTWVITRPDATTIAGAGAVATVPANQPGTFSATFTASTARECAPPPLTMGPVTVDVQTTATLTLEPSFIPASTQWPGMPDVGHSIITVEWDPPECEGTLEIVNVIGNDGYVPPGNGSLAPSGVNQWRYDAFDEPASEPCPKIVTVSIAAMKGGVELTRKNILVYPIHSWTVQAHADGPGTPTLPPDVNDFTNDYNYLRWKYATLLATTGGAFTSGVNISTEYRVVCPIIVGVEAYACTTCIPLMGCSVVFGTSTFADTENQAVSIFGHELTHTVGASECDAYQWESDHRFQTAIYPCAQSYDDIVNDYLFEHMCP